MLLPVFIFLLSYFVNCCFATCPEGWSSWNDSCYRVYENANWHDAESECKLYSAHLASIHSFDENLFVADLLNYPGADVCKPEPQGWIGLYTTAEFKNWYWTDGTPTDYLYWFPTQPVQGSGNCIYMHAAPICGGKIGTFANGMQCGGVAKKFVCKKKSTELQNGQSKIAGVPKLIAKTAEPHYCLEGWSFWNGKCYAILHSIAFSWLQSERTENWHDAEKRCNVHGAHLASIHSAEENLYLADLANYPGAHVCNAVPQAWIGLHRVGNVWKWSDGTPTDYLKWWPQYPDIAPANECAYMHIAPICNGKMGFFASAVPCSQALNKYICKKDPEITNVPKPIKLVSKPEECPENWVFWNENCYRVYENANWFQAESACKLNDSNLASIHSFDENLFVANLLNYPGADVCQAEPQGWIGLYTDDDLKSWKWTDGTPTDYHYWFPNQPIRGTSNCVYMHAAPICSGKIGAFANYLQCNKAAKKFVCKKKSQAKNKVAASTAVVINPRRSDCLESWSFWNGSCYKVLEGSTWHDAENRCKLYNAHLASIHSFQENLYLADLANYPGADVCNAVPQGWIGLYKENNEWKWSDGTSIDYLKWWPQYPDSTAANGCAYMHIAPICNGKMGFFANSVPCSTVLKKFICKAQPTETKDVIFEEAPGDIVDELTATTAAKIKKDVPLVTKTHNIESCFV